MQVLKKISLFLLFLTALSACKKDNNVPGIDETEVRVEQILGTWEIAGTKAYVNVNPSYKAQLAPLNLDSKLQETLDEKSNRSAFHFEKDTVYFIQYGMIRNSCKFVLDEYKIHLENPNLIGFYAPYFYIKFSDELLVTYLRKNETFELLANDKGISSFYMDLIRKVVDDAQCELRFRYSEVSFFDDNYPHYQD